MPAQRRTTEKRARWCTAGHVSPAQPCRGAPRLAFPCPATSPGLSTHEPRPFAHRAREQLGGHPAGSGWAREVGGSCCKPRARAHGEWGDGQSLAARIRDSAAQPSAVPCGRTFFCKQRACGGWAMGSTRRSTCCTAVLVHSKKRLHTATHRPLAHCRHVPSPLLAPPTSIFCEHCVVRFPIDNIQDKCQAGSIRTSNFV